MKTFEFVDKIPAHKDSARLRVQEFARTLRKFPDHWGVWPNEITSGTAGVTGSHINHARHRTFPDGLFAARTRDGVLFVRYAPKGK